VWVHDLRYPAERAVLISLLMSICNHFGHDSIVVVLLNTRDPRQSPHSLRQGLRWWGICRPGLATPTPEHVMKELDGVATPIPMGRDAAQDIVDPRLSRPFVHRTFD